MLTGNHFLNKILFPRLLFSVFIVLALHFAVNLRVKSLSKGNNSKKDVSSSTLNLKESTTLSFSAVVPSTSTFEDDTGDSWPEQTDKDEYDEDFYEQEKPMSKKNEKLDGYSISNSEDKMKRANAQTKWKEPPRTEAKYSNSDDDLNALLKVNLYFGKLRNFT